MKIFTSHSRFRHVALIFLVSVLTTLITGYRFADADQNFHLPFLWKAVDPSLYPGNPFIELGNNQYSFFWQLFVPLLKAGISLDWIAFSVFFLSLYLFFEAFHRLLRIHIPDRNAAYLGLLAVITPTFSFSIMPAYENYLVNRFFVMPFLIYAIVHFLKGRLLPAFIILGLAYNFHALSVHFVLFMFVIVILTRWRRKQVDLRAVMASFAIFLILASPVFLWRLSQGGMDFTYDREWYQTINEGALRHIFHLFSFSPPVIMLSIFGLGNTFVFIWAWRQRPSDTHGEIRSQQGAFFAAIFFVLVVAVITAELWPVTTVIQLQLSRVGKFIPVLAYPFFIGFVYEESRRGNLTRKDYYLVLATIAISAWLAPAWLAYKAAKVNHPIKWALPFAAAAIMISIVFYVHGLGVWKPGISISPADTPWHDVQIWARENTEEGDLFITPLDHWGHYESDFMVLSQRGTVVTLGELLFIAYHPGYFPEWKERFETLAPGAIEEFNGHLGENKEMVAQIYRQNSSADFLFAAQKYAASYVVVESDILLEFELVYQNEGYKVYYVDPERNSD